MIKDEKTVIVMDNARIHGNEVRGFLEENGVGFVYLPPYSPHKSPAGGPWAALKKRLYSNIYTDFEPNLKRLAYSEGIQNTSV